MQRKPIQPPENQPPRYSLLGIAPEADTGGTGDQWVDGFTYQPESCDNGGIVDIGCQRTGTLTTGTQPNIINGDPFLLTADDSCAPFGWRARDWEGRARRLLTRVESYQFANELWSGAIRQGKADGVNHYFAEAAVNSDTVTNGPSAELTALSNLEDALASGLSGGRGMVHCTPGVLARLVGMRAIYRDGNVWLTPMGHFVVADAGYDGSGPGNFDDPTVSWMYGTDMIHVLLGDVWLNPNSLEEARDYADGALDTDVNDVTIWAQRPAGYVWSRCAHYAAEVDAPAALIGGS